MITVIHTDASTKDGYSCWVYKSSSDEKYHAGIVHTSNSAAVESLAAVKAIDNAPVGERLLIISDSAVTVKAIQSPKLYWPDPHAPFFRQIQNRLMLQATLVDVDAVWVPSKSTNKVHIEVDNLAKLLLQNFLKGLK